MCMFLYKQVKRVVRYLTQKTTLGKHRAKNVPKRFIFAILGFLGCVNLYTMRVNLNIAIVKMASHHELKIPGAENAIECQELIPEQVYSNRSVSEHRRQGEFQWDSRMQGLILGSFYYGYIVTQIPGGYLAGKYNAKWVFGSGILLTAVFSLLTPLAARWNVWALILIRVIEGLASGVVYPSLNTLLGRWSPVMERTRMSNFVFSGGYVGTIVSMMFSGVLCDMNFFGGWPLVFYVFGMLGCVWFLFWITFVDECPLSHSTIHKEELEYIKHQQEKTLRNVPVPWKCLFSSRPFWAMIVVFLCIDWSFYIVLLELPTYLSNVFHIDIEHNGASSALPPLMSCIGALSGSVVADKLRATERFRITTIRKIFTSVGTFVPAIFILIIASVGCQPSLVLVLFSLAMGVNAVVCSGVMVSHIDMSPAHAGILFGMTNTAGNISGFLVPSYVGWIIDDQHTIKNWRKVFISSFVMYIISGTTYVLFGSSELQSWGEASVSKPIRDDEDFELRKMLPDVENEPYIT